MRPSSEKVLKVPASARSPTVEPGTETRDGAWTAELDSGVLEDRPMGTRLIVRKEQPHPGAQLRFTDADGLWLTCFAANTTGSNMTDPELGHRRRARDVDRIRNTRATGLRNLPLHATAQNRICLGIVQRALDLLVWMPMLTLTGKPRLWEQRRLRLRLFSVAAQLITTARGRHLRFARHWPWSDASSRLDTLPNTG